MNSEFIYDLNILLAPIVGLVLILIDFRRKSHFDKTQLRLMVCIIICTLAAMLSELGYDAVKGMAGNNIRNICWAMNTSYFFFQTVAFGFVSLFLEFSTTKDYSRLKKISIVVGMIIALNIIALAINLFTGVIFAISPDNYYIYGDLYIFRLIISYSFVLLIITNTMVSRKHMNRNLFTLVLISVLPSVIGSTLDLVIPNARLNWPCFFISVLFAYMFIIRMNASIDSLTGLYNRCSCDEFLHSLSKTVRNKDYSFIMIDVDKFKNINDTFGHVQGDNALKDVADILRISVRRNDFVARYGGDEFVIIADAGEPDKIINHITHEITMFNSKNNWPYTLSLSCGIGVYTPDDLRTPKEFLAYTDSLMYDQKIERRKTND